MVPVDGVSELGDEVAADARVAAVAPQVLAAARPLAVIEEGRIVGALTRDAVLAAFVGGPGRA
jgi:hypothetical protein